MSRSLDKCRLHPGWMRPFLLAIENGYTEKNAANMSGVGTYIIHKRVNNDADFKTAYDEALAKQRSQYGRWTW